MKTVTTVAAAAVIAAGIASAAAANAAPSGHPTADAVVMQLQAQGNTVVVNRTGSHPLSCRRRLKTDPVSTPEF